MTNPEAVEALVQDVERDIRIAIWNGLRASGLNQEFAQIYIRAIMAESLMSRSLAALSSAPVAPEGFVIVPRVPTEAMWSAAWDASEDYFVSDAITKEGFRRGLAAMLAASTPKDTGERG